MPKEPPQPNDANDTEGRGQLLRFSLVGLDFDRAELLAIDEEPCHFIREHSGDVMLFETDEAPDTKIGRFTAVYVDVDGAINARTSVFDVFDSEQRTLPYFELYDDDLFFAGAALKPTGIEIVFERNLLILDRLEIWPAYRGRGYGLAALAGLIHWLQPGAGLVAMKPLNRPGFCGGPLI